MNHVDVIEVRIWGESVGAVAAAPNQRVYSFEYEPSWRRRGIELSPLLMPSSATPGLFSFPRLSEETFLGLPGLLVDALPDRFGNALIDAWMQARGIRAEEVTALDRLAYMGSRGIGALEFRPATNRARKTLEPVQMKDLVETARSVLAGSMASNSKAEKALRNLISVGTSAGGARAKAVIALNPQTQELRSGQFDVPEGFEHWLLKFDGMSDPQLSYTQGYGRIEYAYHLMARAAGITMQDCRLLKENGRAHFMTRRFDRLGNERLHYQSLCGIAHLYYDVVGVHSYGQYFGVIKALGLGDDALSEAFRRMVFNAVARNCDDHSKNFGFLLRKGGAWRLAPAFDVTFAYKPSSRWNAHQSLTINGKVSEFTRADLVSEGRRALVPGPELLIEQVTAAIARWPEFASLAGLEASSAQNIQQAFVRV